MSRAPQRFGRRQAWLVGLTLVATAATAGCGSPPQVGATNYRLVDSLRTAISARRIDWLDATAKVVDERHADGKMTDVQFAAFAAILTLAREGQWEQAETEVVRLAKAQRATPEEIEERRAGRRIR